MQSSAIFISFCVVLWCVFTIWVTYCDVRYDFRIKTMFGSSVPQVVCWRAHVLYKLCMFLCVWWCPAHNVLCFCFVFLLLVCPMLPVPLDCPFFITISKFSSLFNRINIIQMTSSVSRRLYIVCIMFKVTRAFLITTLFVW